jgi:hypothetical protein
MQAVHVLVQGGTAPVRRERLRDVERTVDQPPGD